MGIRGDFGKLDRFINTLERLGDNRTLEKLSKNLCEEALSLTAQGFRDQADPYGSKWRGKKRPDGRAILVGKTARLRRSWHRVRVDSRGFRIATGVTYGSYHQLGTSRMVARKMVPDPGALPPKWRHAMNQAAREFLSSHFARKVKK